jgi:hypothetical protein
MRQFLFWGLGKVDKIHRRVVRTRAERLEFRGFRTECQPGPQGEAATVTHHFVEGALQVRWCGVVYGGVELFTVGTENRHATGDEDAAVRK